MAEWPTVQLGDLCADEPGAIAIGPFGSRMKADTYVAKGVPVIRGTNISDNREWKGDWVFVSEETANSMLNCNARSGDLVFPHRGSIGEVAIVGDGFPRYMLSTSLMKFSADVRKADALFLFYYFRSPRGHQEIMTFASQVGTPGIGQPLTSLRQFRVPFPPLETQQTIAAVLGSLDDKIAVNHKINKIIDAMADALFRDWFIDFGPTQAKINGRDPYLSPELWALFPSSLDDDGKPSGWMNSEIREFASSIQYGLTQSAKPKGPGPQFLRITDIQGGNVSWSSVPYCDVDEDDEKKYTLVDGDVVVARTGASTGENTYLVDPPRSVFASYLVRFQFSEAPTARAVGQFMRSVEYRSFVAGNIGGSAQPNASAQLLASARMTLAPAPILQAFFDLVSPMDQMKRNNERENVSLAQTRDRLLPKLMAGDRFLQDAEGEQQRGL